MKKISLKILTPRGLYKETEASIINVVSEDGQRGILPSHMPIVMILTIGRMEVEEDVREVYAVSGGMLYFKDDVCTIVCNAIESKSEIDKERAKEAKKRAEDHMSDGQSDIKRAQAALARAMNRLKIADIY